MKRDVVGALEILPSFLEERFNIGIDKLKLHSLDNPGWLFRFLPRAPFFKDDIDWVKLDKSDDDWLFWRIKSNCFEFACSKRNLFFALEIFFTRFGECSQNKFSVKSDELISNLENWYSDSCNDDWEHSGGVELYLDGAVWKLDVDFYDLVYDYENAKASACKNSDSDWYECSVHDEHFYGRASLNNLHVILEKLFESINNF